MNIPEEYARKREAEAALKKRWDEVAMQLAKHIPASCQTFGESQKWIRSEDPNQHQDWRLPTDLMGWVERMERSEFGLYMKFCDADLEDLGLVDGKNALKKLRSLQRAWKDHIRITLHCDRNRGEIDVIHVTLYIRGIEKKES